ncbi:MAG TPA: NAD-binding protein [Pseudomonadales bacterium]|nr:NAD-binding protein [Pseudomonadales bacterium]
MPRFLILVLPLLVVFSLGLVGVARTGIDLPALQRVYLVLQLFALEGDWTTSLTSLPWQLEVARFLAPVTTLASLAWVFVARSRIAVSNALTRFARDHVLCVGLSERTWYFLLACRQVGRRVTVITDRTDQGLVSEARRLGHRVIEVARTDDAVLLAAGILRAGHLVVFTDEDGENVEIALRVKRLLARNRGTAGRRPLQIHLHLEDTRLATRLEDYPKFFEDYDVAEVGFFNVHERSARQLFTEYALERYADILGAERVHLAIFGRGALAEAILLHALRQAHYADGAPPRITVFCEQAHHARESFDAAHPHASDAGELQWIDTNYADGELAATLPQDILRAVTSYIVCLDPDVRALRYALALRSAVLTGIGENGPIFVSMRQGRGLARLLESGTGAPEVPDGIYPFGMLEGVLAAAQVLDERQDLLARALHADYLETIDGPISADMLTPPSHRPWNQLPEVYRRESRNQADHLETKLRSVDRALHRHGAEQPFTPAEVDALAELEQRRWMATRATYGWHYGPERSDLQKLNPAMLPFDELSEDLQARNRAAIAHLPDMLRTRARTRCRPVVYIGVSGHRPDRLPEKLSNLERTLRRTMDRIRSAWPGADFVILSALAEGTDRIAARIAMEHLGATLQVPLPLPYEIYLESFGGAEGKGRAASANEFRELVGRADCYFELPLRFGTYEDLAAPGAESLRARQYALAGAWILARSHEFIAVWDGAPARGEGSTADLIKWLHGEVPEDYRFEDRYFPHRGGRAPWILPADPVLDHAPERAAP